MKNGEYIWKALISSALMVIVCLLGACDDDIIPGGQHDPVWAYDTGENPYGSKPCIAGNRLLVCSRMEGEDTGTVHCVNLSDGKNVWKMTDSTVVRNNPVVWKDLVIYGGYNAHALNLKDGSHAWDYQDDPVHFALYSSPTLKDGYVYMGFTYALIKLDADNGSLVWENTENFYQNMSLTAPYYDSGKIYYGTTLGLACALSASSGSIDWSVELESGISNCPLAADDRVYVGIMEMSLTKNSLFCYSMNGTTPAWSAKLSQIIANMAISGSRLYVAGASTFFCLDASSGAEQWTYDMPSGTVSEPVIHDGKVYTGNGDQLLCLDSSTGKVDWKYSAGGKGFSSPAISGDRLYVACGDGKIYCFAL